MQSKILFIHPPAANNSKILSGLKYPPMGIAFLAAFIRKKGYAVKIFDANVESDPLKKIGEILKKYKPTIIGISFTSLLAESAKQVAQLVKSIDPNIIVMAGGYHPTAMPLEVIKNDNFDFVVVGEGELVLLETLQKFDNGENDFSQVRGLVFRKGNEIIQTKRRELIPDIDILPFPAYDLLPINKYSSLSSTRKPYITFIRSRGCPFYCLFCGVQKMFGRQYRCQSPEKTISEIDELVRDFHIKEINFKDSDFLIDKNNVKKLCELMIAKNYDLIWTCNARVDMVNEEILPLMKEAGCSLITFGVESGNQEILDALKKGITLEQIEKAASLAKKNNIRCTFDMIIGGPGETKETVEKTLKFLEKINPDYVSFTSLTAFPGSELYDKALINGWFINKDAIDYGYEELNLNATRISNEELAKMPKYVIKSFYFRPAYILGRLKYLTFSDMKNNFKGIWKIIKSLLFQ